MYKCLWGTGYSETKRSTSANFIESTYIYTLKLFKTLILCEEEWAYIVHLHTWTWPRHKCKDLQSLFYEANNFLWKFRPFAEEIHKENIALLPPPN